MGRDALRQVCDGAKPYGMTPWKLRASPTLSSQYEDTTITIQANSNATIETSCRNGVSKVSHVRG
jgi:hypothetical protein